jgi:hypothetical protein
MSLNDHVEQMMMVEALGKTYMELIEFYNYLTIKVKHMKINED